VADIVRELAAKLGLDFQASEFLKAEVAFEGIKKAAELAWDSIEKVVDVLADAVISTAEQAEHLQHLSARTGIATTDLQELGYAAERSDVSLDAVALSMAHLGAAALAASKGQKEAVEAFADLGVSIHDANGKLKDTQKLFLEVGAKVAALPDKLTAPAKAMKLMGKTAGELIPVFAEGEAAFEGLRNQAHDLGIVMDEETVRKAAELNGIFEQLKHITAGLAHDFAGPLLEPLTEVGERFLDWFKANRAIIKQGIEKFARGLVAAFTALGKALAWVAKYWDGLLIALGSVALAIFLNTVELGALTTGFIEAGIAAVTAGAEAAAAWLAAAAPVAILAALIALIALAAEDVYQFLTGGDSLIGDLGPKWTKFLNEFTTFKGEDPWWLMIIKAGVKGLTDLNWALEQFKSAWTLFDSSFKLGGAVGALQSVGRALIPGFGTQGVDVSFDPALGLNAAPSLPSMTATVAGGKRGAVSNTVHVPINVQVGPGTSPYDVAQAVGEEVDRRLRTHLQDAAAATE
jgi:hypothetical protein